MGMDILVGSERQFDVSHPSGSYNLTRYSSDGDVIWRALALDPSATNAGGLRVQSVAAGTDGNIYVGVPAHTIDSDNGSPVLPRVDLVCLNPHGCFRWSRHSWIGAPIANNTAARSIDFDPFTGAFVTAHNTPAPDTNHYLFKRFYTQGEDQPCNDPVWVSGGQLWGRGPSVLSDFGGMRNVRVNKITREITGGWGRGYEQYSETGFALRSVDTSSNPWTGAYVNSMLRRLDVHDATGHVWVVAGATNFWHDGVQYNLGVQKRDQFGGILFLHNFGGVVEDVSVNQNDGSAIIIGNANASSDIIIRKYSSSGDVLFSIARPPSWGSQQPLRVRVDPSDGSFVVTFNSVSTVPNNLRKFSSTGTLLWETYSEANFLFSDLTFIEPLSPSLRPIILKYHNGNEWKEGKLMRHIGDWEAAPIRTWDGSQWILRNQEE